MTKYLILIIFTFACVNIQANEAFVVDPTQYTISGADVDGNEAYFVTIKYVWKKQALVLESITVKIYEESITVDSEILSKMENIHIEKITATNDAGVFGSYFYIQIPYGKSLSCKSAKKSGSTKSVNISSLPTMQNEPLSVNISNPCEKP